MWAGLNHGNDRFGQASLQRDWQFATDRIHGMPFYRKTEISGANADAIGAYLARNNK